MSNVSQVLLYLLPNQGLSQKYFSLLVVDNRLCKHFNTEPERLRIWVYKQKTFVLKISIPALHFRHNSFETACMWRSMRQLQPIILDNPSGINLY